MATNLDITQTASMLQYLQNGRKKAESFIVNPDPTGFQDVLLRSLTSGQAQQFNPIQTGPGIDPAAGFNDEDAKFRKCLDFVLEKEGTRLVKEDGERGASRYGILQSTARALGYRGSIKNITREQIEGIYRKLWERSGASSLPYPLCVVHFDTYVNSPAAAQKILRRSQGNIDSYLGMREQRYVRLAAAKPQVYAKYLKGWKNRVNSLRTVVAEFEKNTMYARNDLSTIKKG
ncbi:MAG: glycosyl hydrolase 108 family protein [Syntrophorhabdaceae bacterium]|nr:glycosyl hydrolase 108 family protein [Syntrophorhabdaceae bacterium]